MNEAKNPLATLFKTEASRFESIEFSLRLISQTFGADAISRKSYLCLPIKTI